VVRNYGGLMNNRSTESSWRGSFSEGRRAQRQVDAGPPTFSIPFSIFHNAAAKYNESIHKIKHRHERSHQRLKLHVVFLPPQRFTTIHPLLHRSQAFGAYHPSPPLPITSLACYPLSTHSLCRSSSSRLLTPTIPRTPLTFQPFSRR
jgi:hypothetical protein